jgi:hypothetical protein
MGRWVVRDFDEQKKAKQPPQWRGFSAFLGDRDPLCGGGRLAHLSPVGRLQAISGLSKITLSKKRAWQKA